MADLYENEVIVHLQAAKASMEVALRAAMSQGWNFRALGEITEAGKSVSYVAETLAATAYAYETRKVAREAA